MKTITVRANEISQPVYAGAGSRITLTGSGRVEWAAVEKLQDALNGATWNTWPAGSTAGYRDTERGMAVRVVGTGACTVTIEEGKGDPANEGAYWQPVGDGVSAITNTLTGRSANTIYPLTQSQYDALGTYDANTIYLITGASIRVGGPSQTGGLLFAFLGDPQIGSGTDREQRDVLNFRRQTQALKAGGVDLAFLMGDQIMNGTAAQAAWQHDAMLFAQRELSPIENYPMVGNHDVWNNATGLETTGGSAALATLLSGGGRAAALGMPAAGLANLGCYTTDISTATESVRFVVWNSDPTRSAFAYPSKYTSGEHDTCMAWLDAAITSAVAWRGSDPTKHIIFLLHQPLYQSSIGEANTEITIPNGLTGFTYNNPRTTIDGWVRAAKIRWLMSGHSGQNRSLTVPESSPGADDGYTLTETSGTSIVAQAQVQAYRTLEINGSSAQQSLIALSTTPAFSNPAWTAYDTAIIADALHYFRFDETGGVAVIDEIGTNAGAMRWSYSGSLGYAVPALGALSGTALSLINGYIFSEGPFMPITGSQTYAYVHQWSAAGTVRGVFQCGVLGGTGANKGVAVRVTATEAVEWMVANGVGDRVTVTTAPLALGVPHAIQCVYDAGDNTARIYVDGALAGSAACVGFTPATNNLMQIGTVGAQRGTGVIDQFSMHQRAFSLGDATTLSAAAI